MPRPKTLVFDRDLVRAVLREVGARGPVKLSMDAIARDLGISPAVLYRRFPSRRALLTATFELFDEHMSTHLDGLFGDCPEATPFEVFWGLLVKLFVQDPQGRAFMTLYLARESFLAADRLDKVIPVTIDWWLEHNARDLGPAPRAIQARIIWGFLFAMLLARGGQPERRPGLARTLGEACRAALRHGWKEPSIDSSPRVSAR